MESNNELTNLRKSVKIHKRLVVSLSACLGAAGVAAIVAPTMVSVLKKGGTEEHEVVTETKTVTFDDCAPTGTSTVDTVKVTKGEVTTSHQPSRVEGYGFLGWKTVKNDGSEAAKQAPYFDFVSKAITADITLYGWWQAALPQEQIITTEPTKNPTIPLTFDASTGGVTLNRSFSLTDPEKIKELYKVLVVPSCYVDPETNEKHPITSISESAFDPTLSQAVDLTEVIESISLPDTITKIGDYAFAGNKKLKTINMPKSLISLGDWAFIDCYNLEEVRLYEGITYVGQAFAGYSTSEAHEKELKPVPGNLSSSNKVAPAQYGEIYYSYIKKVDFPSTLADLDSGAFEYSCVESVDLSKTNIKYLYGAFKYCTIKDIKLPSALLGIGYESFYYCPCLTSITIPATVESIGYEAFCGCASLSEVKFESGSHLLSIENYAFYDCRALMHITIPTYTKYIGNNAFAYTSLRRLDFEDTSKAWFYNGTYTWQPSGNSVKDANDVLEFTGDSSMNIAESYNEELGIGYITNGVDRCLITACQPKDGVLNIPATITETTESGEEKTYKVVGIDTYNYFNNSGYEYIDTITEIKFPKDNYIEYICGYSFSSGWYNGSHESTWALRNLSKINFEDLTNLTSIGEYTFFNCFTTKDEITQGTIKIDLSKTKIDYLGENVFAKADNDGYTSLFLSAVMPASLETVAPGTFMNCTNLETFDFSACEHLKTFEYDYEGDFWSIAYDTKVKTIDLSKTKLTVLPQYLFDSMSVLETVSLPSTIQTIGYDCFYYTPKLTKLTIPSNCWYMGSYVFEASGVTEVTFEDTASKWLLTSTKERSLITKDYDDVSVPATNAKAFTTDYLEYSWLKKAE